MPRPRGAQNSEPVVTRSIEAGWPPRCVERRANPAADPPAGCDFVGEPSDESSPYLACGGDFRRHYRAELTAPTVLDELDPQPAPSTIGPRRPPRPRTVERVPPSASVTQPSVPRSGRKHEVVDRIMCPTCRRPDTAVIRYSDGLTVIIGHGPTAHRCPMGGQVPPTR